tara:strand:- start:796 stop:1056 length:261 start_codon:yes stop_codon:yes gene_type:complete
MNLSNRNATIDPGPEPERYYEWMLWKMRQDDKVEVNFQEKLEERINRSNEYSIKTVDERADEILRLKDRIKRLEEDMAYMKKETYE